jgi:hypothetical protein
MEDLIEKIKYKDGININVYRDDTSPSPDRWHSDEVFIVAYHRDFTVKRDDIITKECAIAIARGEEDEGCKEILKKYYLFGLEAYIHGGVVLSFSYEGNFPDRGWDVSQIGFVLVKRGICKNKKEAREIARSLIDEWNDYLSGNVYGYMIEVEDVDGSGNKEEVGGCWGFYGDYNKSGLLEEAKEEAEREYKKRIKMIEELKNKQKDKNITEITLGELLSYEDEIVRRHAIGILKRINR